MDNSQAANILYQMIRRKKIVIVNEERAANRKKLHFSLCQRLKCSFPLGAAGGIRTHVRLPAN